MDAQTKKSVVLRPQSLEPAPERAFRQSRHRLRDCQLRLPIVSATMKATAAMRATAATGEDSAAARECGPPPPWPAAHVMGLSVTEVIPIIKVINRLIFMLSSSVAGYMVAIARPRDFALLPKS